MPRPGTTRPRNYTPVDPRRQSGRTTRMLDAAVDLARAGEYVAVIVADGAQVFHLYRHLLEYAGARGTSAQNGKVYFDVDDGATPAGSVSLIPLTHDAVDMRTGRVRGAHPSVHVLADHHAVERWAGWALAQWREWNLV